MRMRSLLTCLAAMALLPAVARPLPAAESAAEPAAEPVARPTAKDLEFFEKKVRPLLVAHCYECHTGEDPEGGLSMESLAGLLTGGLRGAALVPGQPDKSLLITAIRHNEELKMPPKRKLSTPLRAVLTEWVKRGAAWPNAKLPPKPKGRPGGKSGPLFTEAQKQFWAFQPVRTGPLPKVTRKGWVRGPVDQFILARLEAAGLAPAAEADRVAWLRRVTFDLTGLPPTSPELNAFLADTSAAPHARVVDRLLGSPGFGERWARHWLDVARYADSNGLDENLCYGNAFRYRDYVIAAFNADRPYDQFVREQIAGDLLPRTGNLDEDLQQLVATGFLVLGPKMLAEDDPRKMEMDIIDEQIDTLGRTFLGLTLGCARCHDHKFDPIPTADYYSLAGIFKSTRTMQNFSVVAKWNERELADDAMIARQRSHKQKIEAARERIAATVARGQQEVLAVARRRAGDYLLAATSTWLRSRLLTSRKPLGGTPAADRPGVVLREAETFDRGNAAKLSTGYGEGIGVILNGGKIPNVAEYDVTVKTAGAYRIEFRVAAAESRPCRLLVNGAVLRPTALGHTTGTWNPDTQKWFVEGLAELKAGKNTIRIDRDGPFPHIDKLLIAPAGNQQEGGQLAELVEASAAIRDRDGLDPPLLQQWVAYLEKTRKDAKSPLAFWHLRAAGTVSPSPSTGPLLKGFAKRPLAEVAGRYAELFTAIDDEWLALSGKGDKPAADLQLADPVREALRQVLYAGDGPFRASKELEGLFSKQIAGSIKSDRETLKALGKAKPELPLAMAVGEGKIGDLRVHIRGNYLTLGTPAPRRFPRVLAGLEQPPIAKTTSGRRELATWLASRDNPLVPRVIVNRLWRWHFGHGVVRSPDNFGSLGERPTHPRLLDWLAAELLRRDWSLKSLHRTIVLSATYRMSTRYDAAAAAADPENRLQWRMDRRRLSAEELRDALLAVGGSLDRQMGGTLLAVKNRDYVTSTGSNMKADVYRNARRSVYQPVIRSALYDVFQAFDFADPSMPNGDRVTTTVAPQALFLMNSRLVAEQSLAVAKQVLAADSPGPARVAGLYHRLLGREPTSVESNQASEFLSVYRRAIGNNDKNKTAPTAEIQSWQSLCRVLMASTEFVYCE